LYFDVKEDEVYRNKKKSIVKKFFGSLIFVNVELDERFKLVYSLDMLKVTVFDVWSKLF
jgi:hypothetical protein